MIQIIEKIHREIENQVADGVQFTESLQESFQELFNLTAENSGLYELSTSELDEILDLSFKSRIKLNGKVDDFAIGDKEDEDQLLARVYDMNRALRYLEDYVLEIAMRNQLTNDHHYKTLSGNGPYFRVAKGQNLSGVKDLQSGDIILTRGSAFTSAAIARIGTNDTQFSHLSFVYINSDEKEKVYTVEAHIEIGSVVAPIATHIQQKNSRTVVYRYEDPKLAHAAAAYMFDLVKTASDNGKNIEYNFSMQYKDNSRLFCSQVIYEGFFQASDQSLDVPRYKSQFNKGLIPFLNLLQIPATLENIDEMETFSPGDIEFDDRFTLVAEWSDPKQLRDSRVKDAILTKMFSWMDNEKYHIHPPLGVRVMSRVIWLLRRTPLLQKLVEKKLPLNMTVDQLHIFITLDKIGKVLKTKISTVQDAQKNSLSIKEIFDLLEDFKESDKKAQKPQFHQWFHQLKD